MIYDIFKRNIFLSIILLLISLNMRGQEEITPQMVIDYVSILLAEDSVENYTFLKDRAHSFYQLQDYRNALIDYNLYLKKYEKDYYSYFARGIVKANLIMNDEAINDFKEALKGDTLTAEIYFSTGSAYQSMEEYELAVKNFKKSLEFNSFYTGTYNNLGLTYIEMEKLDSAILFLDKAIALDSMKINTLNNRGYAHILAKNYEKAFVDLNKSIELDSDNPYALSYLGYYYYKLGELEKACIYHQLIKNKIEPLYECNN